MRNAVHVLMLMFALAVVAIGQTFSSGSTGVDGPLDLSSGDRTVQLPASGILHYTTVNIPLGRTLRFQNNLANTPVVLLAQGGVNIAGTINICASGNVPAPGGFYGGFAPESPGLGPGGGAPNSPGTQTQGSGGNWAGPLSLVPITGGSGGGGGFCCVGCFYGAYAVAGGAGGGGITIASSTGIGLTGSILANGSSAVTRFQIFSSEYTCSGASGSNGAVRLVANAVSVSGNISAATVRLEGPAGQVSYSGSGMAPVISLVNPLIAPTKPPSIFFSSIGGYQVPSYSGSSFTTIDLLLPTQLQDPIPIVIRGTNIPVGSPISISYSGPGGPTFTTATLSGTTSSSTATVYASGLSRSGVTFLFVLATFDPTLIATDLKQVGPNAVAKVELAAAPGQEGTFRFLRRDGSEVTLSNVPVQLRRALGL